MSGVEILAKTVEPGCSLGRTLYYVAVSLLAMALTILSARGVRLGNKSVGDVARCTVQVVLTSILVVIGIYSIKEYRKIETTYQVTISESVPFVEFNRKYEIIDQHGKIYTIKERTEVN